ncbi:MAG: hypothetical protein U5O39_12340 [Gammaproteobacteria bacterium]|nr:hypothetical protein [Gammaproteobacteria bacterium]
MDDAMRNNSRRRCPECQCNGVPVEDVYPDGTQCLHCGKHIEVDTTFILLLLGALVVLTLLDFHVWGTGYVGVPCSILLIAIGLGLNAIYRRFMPLRHYSDVP